ncbi:hypothetical protein SBI67_14795 [Mycolicibacterium sp. 120266]|uniref:hypothetical protein n=1 Tax=Mycolicibacterium sp. 120266 TaxID=3090601 RepID=UPI00299EC4BB|nr:hypothetical protein [Mycolicibacterium sp. 120266]MDX1873387.1 hypothetical protein [Mycolicibacterium sp. 120266]
MAGMTGNELLAQATMIPTYHQVRFAALGSRTVPEFDDDADDYLADESSIHVYTFADDQDEHADRTVDIRVYRGTDTAGLGRLIFDAALKFLQPELTFGSALETEDSHHHVPLSRAGSIPIRVLTRESQPGNGTDEINILIDDS